MRGLRGGGVEALEPETTENSESGWLLRCEEGGGGLLRGSRKQQEMGKEVEGRPEMEGALRRRTLDGILGI